MNNFKTNLIKQAFTLIELLVVVAIIGILSGLIVVSMGGVTQKATYAKAQAFSSSLKNALMLDIAGEWKFDELSSVVNGNTILDSWNGGSNLTLRSDNTTDKLVASSCVSGKCLYLDGVNDYADSPSNVNLAPTGAVTVSTWVKTGTMQTGIGVMTKGPVSSDYDYMLYFTNAGIDFYMKNSAGTADNCGGYGANYADNIWHHYVGVFDGDYLKVYVDGARVCSKNTALTDIRSSANNFNLGRGYNGCFNGYFDNVQVYKAAATLSEVRNQYYTGISQLFSNGSISKEEYVSRMNNFLANAD